MTDHNDSSTISNALQLGYATLTISTAIAGFIAIAGNFMLMLHYYPKRKATAPMLYLFLTGTDCATGLSASGIFIALLKAQLNSGLDLTFKVSVQNPNLLIKTYSFIFFVSTRASVFTMCTMSVTRTIQILSVFYRPNYRCIVTCITCYSVTWVAIAITCFSWGRYTCSDVYVMCVPGFGVKLTKILFYGVPYVIPTVPVLVTGIVTIVTLTRYTSLRSRDKTTVTIAIITIIFLVHNLAFLFHYYFHEMIYDEADHDSEDIRKDEILFFTTHTLSQIVNSALNPLILLARMRVPINAYIPLSVRRITHQRSSQYKFGVCRLSTTLPTYPLADKFNKISTSTYIVPTRICRRYEICDINTILENVAENEKTYSTKL